MVQITLTERDVKNLSLAIQNYSHLNMTMCKQAKILPTKDQIELIMYVKELVEQIKEKMKWSNYL